MKKIDVLRGVNTYWMKYPLRAALGHNHSISIQGGEEDFQYHARIYYNNDPGVMKKSKRDNFSGSMKFVYNKEKFQFMNELEVNITSSSNSPYGTEGAFGNYSLKNPYYTPYDENGVLKKDLHDYQNWLSDGLNNTSWGGTKDDNPLYDAQQPQRHTSNTFSVVDRFNFEWRILPGLRVSGQASVSTDRNRSDDYLSNGMIVFAGIPPDKASYKGRYNMNMGSGDMIDTRLTVQYDKLFKEKHLLTASIFGELYQRRNENYSFAAYGISNPENIFFGSAEHWLNHNDSGQPSGSDIVTRNAGVSGHVTYIYDERYFVNSTLKFEGSSIFGENNVYAPNWMFGVGWNVHNEKFLDFDWVNSIRLKANYGTVGSQNFYPYMSRILFNNSDRLYEQWGGSSIGNLGNRDLAWEKTYSFNAGVDMSLLDSRLNVEFNWYDRRTHDLVSSVGLPSAAGFTSYYANIGKGKNTGWDLNANYAIIRNYDRDFTWRVILTAARNKNTLLEISDGLSEMNRQMLAGMGAMPARQFVEGADRDIMYVKKSLGIDPMSGAEIFLDKDGRQTTDWNDAAVVAAGSELPSLFGNINTDLAWKGWRLMLSFRYELNSTIYNRALAQKVEGGDPYSNMDRRALLHRWNSYGQRAQYKSVKAFSDGETKATSRFIAEEDTFELSSVTVSYDVPASWSKKNLGISYLKVTGSTRELLYLSTVKKERGIEYPFARTFNLTLNARF